MNLANYSSRHHVTRHPTLSRLRRTSGESSAPQSFSLAAPRPEHTSAARRRTLAGVLPSIVAMFAIGACGEDDTHVTDQPRELSPGEQRGGSDGAGTEVGSAGTDASPEAGEGGAAFGAPGGASGETNSSGGSAASSSTEPP